MEINELIKKRRLELGLTLKDVAYALGTAESTISRYESSNIQNMGIDKIIALSKVLQCSPTYLLGWSESCNYDNVLSQELKDDDYTEDEIIQIKEYAKFIKSNRMPKPNVPRNHFTNIKEATEYLKAHKMIAAFNGQKEYSDETILQIANAIYKEKGNN